MTVYMVGYDLKSGQDYSKLIAALKTFPNWWHHLDSTWLIVSDHSATEIRDWLLTFIYRNDKLLVMQHTPTVDSAAWFGFPANGNQWLSTNL